MKSKNQLFTVPISDFVNEYLNKPTYDELYHISRAEEHRINDIKRPIIGSNVSHRPTMWGVNIHSSQASGRATRGNP